MSKELKLPPDVQHVPAGREYMTPESASVAWAQFEHELEKLTERYGVHAYMFNGALSVRPVFAGLGVPQPARLTAMGHAGGCAACTMYSIAQSIIINRPLNEIILAALKMAGDTVDDDLPPDLESMDVKGPKQ